MWSYPLSSRSSAASSRDALLEPPGVRVQRTAASLRARDVDVVAVGGQDAGGRCVDVAEDDALDAAGEQRDARSLARQVLRRPRRRAPRRRDSLQPPERPRGRQATQRKRRAQAPAVRQHRERRGAQHAVETPAPMLVFDLGARRLDQAVVLHARRARADAGHAAEAAVEVLNDRVGHRERALRQADHQLDPPARRVHLLVPQRVGRAGRQAEAAVDAVAEQLPVGRGQLVRHSASTTRSASGLQGCSTPSST